MVQASSLVSLTVTLSKKKKKKPGETWVIVTEAVDVASLEVRMVAQVKKKWFDIKVDPKKRTGQG